jgi:hypothetical protein
LTSTAAVGTPFSGWSGGSFARGGVVTGAAVRVIA